MAASAYIRTSGIAGAACCVLALAASLLYPAAALRGWLTAAAFCTGAPIGAVLLVMMMRLIPGAWAGALMPAAEGLTLLLPLAALAFLPVLAGLGAIYPWAGDGALNGFQAGYLTPWFFALRTIAWFAVLIGLAVLLLARRHASVPVACAGLVVCTLSGAVIAVDWVLSLDPSFHSSGFGFYWLSVQMTVALATAMLVAPDPLPEQRPVLAGLLLTALLLWAYLAFMQYVILWSGNLPQGVRWYDNRSGPGWAAVLWTVALLHLAPTLLLMLPRMRGSALVVRWLAATVLLGKAVECAWLVLPGGDAVDIRMGGPAFALAAAGIGLLLRAAYPTAVAWRERISREARPGEAS
ncbi:hypothetical protein [Inquilinus limosus]|uniref:hypothetical protein n=1 Tax=Inquilinus limosus TaxID=171674 RepID=UPI00068C2B8B|nr:hypothetical protein [Inquilinus limosus]